MDGVDDQHQQDEQACEQEHRFAVGVAQVPLFQTDALSGLTHPSTSKMFAGAMPRRERQALLFFM